MYSWFSHGSEQSDEESDSAWEPPFYGDEEEDQLVDDLDWWSKYYASIGDEMLGTDMSGISHHMFLIGLSFAQLLALARIVF